MLMKWDECFGKLRKTIKMSENHQSIDNPICFF